MSSTIVVVPQTHWFNGWFLRLLSRPVVRLNGIEHDASWGLPATFPVKPGQQVVAVGARYLGGRRILGVVDHEVDFPPGGRAVLEFRNGLFNHQPFQVRP